MGLRIGVDIGGSFADFAVLDDVTGSLRTLKVFSRPDDPGSEVLTGMQLLNERYGIHPKDVDYFTHGTTVGVNAVVQRRGLKLALLTTEHFEDVLEVARLKIPDMYHLMSARPVPLVARECVFGVRERTNAQGEVELSVDEQSVRDALSHIEAQGCEGVVVSLLHSYRNPQNERAVKKLLQELRPSLFVSCSHEVWPIIREYERTMTAVIGAYVQPKVSHYLGKLQDALADTGVGAELKVTKSNGGVMSAEMGKSNCVQMILSGTAAGVMGAAYVATQCGVKNCMSLDIGGTTADVALILDGQPQYATGEFIGDYQIHIPSVSVTSIGDGGGSVAWVDEFGVLKVGPESAGSNPGPACYGRGGTRATITDAFAVLGVLGQAPLGYSAVTVDRDRSVAVIEPIAKALGLDIEPTAQAIINVAVSGMYSGVSSLISRFGIDPREFTLMPFGGAGPMLAAYLARSLNMERMLVPTTPGVLSALGGLIADTKNDFVATTYCDLSAQTVAELAQKQNALYEEARQWLESESVAVGSADYRLSADMRYRGQSFEITTPLALDAFERGDIGQIKESFHKEHEKLYGHRDENALVQVIAVRLIALAPTPKPSLEKIDVSSDAPEAFKSARVFVDGASREVPCFMRRDLKATQSVSGPAIIMQDDTTTFLLPGMVASVDPVGNLEVVLASSKSTQSGREAAQPA
jgi:N-methylhydantoinase A